MIKTLPAVAVLAVVAALVAAGCGSSNSSSSSTSSGGAYGSSGTGTTKPATSTSSGTGTAAIVSVGNASKVGQVLVDSKGMTLYYFKKDKKGSGTSACYGSCASVWPPMTSGGAAKATSGAEASQLGTIKRTDGTVQVTYAGWPLYTYTADTKPGEDNGTDLKSFGASWYPLHPNGQKAGH